MDDQFNCLTLILSDAAYGSLTHNIEVIEVIQSIGLLPITLITFVPSLVTTVT